jgi:hypothetical protein
MFNRERKSGKLGRVGAAGFVLTSQPVGPTDAIILHATSKKTAKSWQIGITASSLCRSFNGQLYSRNGTSYFKAECERSSAADGTSALLVEWKGTRIATVHYSFRTRWSFTRQTKTQPSWREQPTIKPRRRSRVSARRLLLHRRFHRKITAKLRWTIL